jgi:hypothetical protein
VSVVAAFSAGRRLPGVPPAAAVFSAITAVDLLIALAAGDVWRWLTVVVMLFSGVLPWPAGTRGCGRC